MKKIAMVLLVVLLMVPSSAYSKKYWRQRLAKIEMPTRNQVVYDVSVYVDMETGELTITPIDPITGLEISITANGVTYLDTTVSLGAGQSYTDCLSFLNVGTYILTLSTTDGIIDQYVITVEDD